MVGHPDAAKSLYHKCRKETTVDIDRSRELASKVPESERPEFEKYCAIAMAATTMIDGFGKP